MLYRCESTESARGKRYFVESVKMTEDMVFEKLDRIGALSRITAWNPAWDVMVEPHEEVPIADSLEQDLLSLGYVHTLSSKTRWYHALHQSRESTFDFSRSEYQLPFILHHDHYWPDSFQRRLSIAKVLTIAYMSYSRSMCRIRRELPQLKDITFWYNPEVIPMEPQHEFLHENSALALELQPFWQTTLGQVAAYQEIGFDMPDLTDGNILHCLVISVYIILSGENVTFELGSESLDSATDRVCKKLRHMQMSEDESLLPRPLLNQMCHALRWERVGYSPLQLPTMYEKLWSVLNEAGRYLKHERLGLIVPRPSKSIQ